LSALKHGLFRVGFMLCDRCVLNARCERFSPGSDCVVEKQAYERLVSELVGQYGLDLVADRILAERAAMCLIRISRAETYESMVGVTEKSTLWGAYISRLDNTLRGLLNDLAVTRAKRKGLEKAEELMVNVEDLLERLTKRTVMVGRRELRKVHRGRREPAILKKRVFEVRPISVYQKILVDWRKEKGKLLRRATKE